MRHGGGRHPRVVDSMRWRRLAGEVLTRLGYGIVHRHRIESEGSGQSRQVTATGGDICGREHSRA